MKVVARLVAGKYLKTLKQADSVEERVLAEAKDQLVTTGRDVIPLVLELLDDRVARASAVEVLTRLLTNQTLPIFIDALSSDNRTVISGVTEVLSAGQRYEAARLLDHLEHTDQTHTRLDPVLQARGGAIPVDKVIPRLPQANSEVRAVLFNLLETHGSPSKVGHYLELLKSEDWLLRAKGLTLLARFPCEAGVEGAVKALRDPKGKVRLEAVHALAKMKDRSSIPALCEALRDNDLKVHSAAIDALIGFHDVSAVTHLIDVLKDESEYARRGAVEVLNEVATQEAIADLVRALGDADWWVRVRAADALGTLGGERVVEAVLRLMSSEDVYIRRYAVEILYAVPNERAVDELVAALQDEDWWVRERSIDALGKIADARAVEPLIQIMRSDRAAAVLCARALGAIGDERAVGPLCDLFTNDDQELAREIREALLAFTRREITAESRERIRGVLGDYSVRQQHSGIMPFDVRSGRSPADPEFGRVDSSRTPLAPQVPDRQPDSTGMELPAQMTTNQMQGAKTMSTQGEDTPAEPTPVPIALMGAADLLPDTMLVDRYRVIRKIGSGGFGSVYLVEDVDVKDEVILKVLRPHISMDETMIQRFVHELKYTRRIVHKNVIRIYDFLKLGTVHAISMEYYPGTDLSTILAQEKRLSPERTVRIVAQICGGLEAAHAEGIIHRDVKPPNILIGEDDFVKIVDFGLASMVQQAGSRLTQSGILIGTPQYMSPEQITGGKIDARSDIYSLGVLMYEMLSGQLPVSGDSPVAILFNHLEGEVAPLKEVAPEVPDAVAELVMKAMARNVDDRLESARHLLEALEAHAA